MFAEILDEFVEKIKEKESEWFDQLKEEFYYENRLRGVERAASSPRVRGGSRRLALHFHPCG